MVNGVAIRVKADTYKELKRRGIFGQTYDDIIRKALKLKKNGKRKTNNKR